MGDSAPKMEFSQLVSLQLLLLRDSTRTTYMEDPHSQLNYARSRQATVTQAVIYAGPRVVCIK
jgi:hypothetical protein